MGRSTAFLVFAVVATFFCFGLACSAFARASDVSTSGQKWGYAFRGLWFFFYPLLMIFTWYKPSPRLMAFCWGAGAFLSLAALALAGEHSDGLDSSTSAVKAVAAFGYLSWLSLTVFCIFVYFKKDTLTEESEGAAPSSKQQQQDAGQKDAAPAQGHFSGPPPLPAQSTMSTKQQV